MGIHIYLCLLDTEEMQPVKKLGAAILLESCLDFFASLVPFTQYPSSTPEFPAETVGS